MKACSRILIYACLCLSPMALSVCAVADEPIPGSGADGQETPAPYRVHLAVDGNIPGSVKVADGAGAVMPVRATISVFRNGLLLSVAQSNEQGRFQLPGLRPGAYSVVADAGDQIGVFAVEVLPRQESIKDGTPVALTSQEGGVVQEGESTLDLTLTAAEAEVPIEPTPMEGYYEYPVMSGGGGGGAGGIGSLGGLASLAGLAGLAGLGGSGTASPATP